MTKAMRNSGMGEARQVAGVAIDQSEMQKEVILEAQKSAKNSPFRYADGHLPSQKRGVGTQITEVEKQSMKSSMAVMYNVATL